jgi:phospholipid/cholesterol/gamma-HCH transport system substrate-binding protein
MTGGGEPAIPKTIYDLSIPSDFAPPKQPLKEQLVMPTPTAILMLDTQRFLLAPSKEIPGFSSAQWADSIPKMLQVNLFQQRRKLDKPDPASAVGAFDDAFGSIATELITWTAGALLALP